MKLAAHVSAPVSTPEVQNPELEVNVVYTRLPGAAKSLGVASGLARGLGARVTVHVAQVIPYPLGCLAVPVQSRNNNPAMQESSRWKRYRIYLADLRKLSASLKPDSVVIVGVKNAGGPLASTGWRRLSGAAVIASFSPMTSVPTTLDGDH